MSDAHGSAEAAARAHGLVLKNGKALCQYCEKALGLGATAASFEGNLKTHLDKNLQCKKVRASGDSAQNRAAQTAGFLEFFAKAKPAVGPTVPAVGSSEPSQAGTQPSAPAPSSEFTSQLPPAEPALLLTFRQQIEKMEGRVPVANEDHPFTRFRNFEGSVVASEQAWEVWDRPIINVLSSVENLGDLMATGVNGLEALHALLVWLAVVHRVPVAAMEGKVERVMHAMETFLNRDVIRPTQQATQQPLVLQPYTVPDSPIDVEMFFNHMEAQTSHPESPASPPINVSAPIYRCVGIVPLFPDGVSAWEGYPLGLHINYGDPWDASIIQGAMHLFSRTCKHTVGAEGATCAPCLEIRSLPQFESVQHHILTPPKVSANLQYYSFGGLVQKHRKQGRNLYAMRLNRLNDSRKIVSRSRALTLYKQWLTAVASGQVVRVDRLVKTELNRGAGIGSILKRFMDAAKQVYKPKNFAQEDYLRGLLIWRLGGARLAGIAHRMLDLPSVDTLRRHTIIPNLNPSISLPTHEEVERNLQSCFQEIAEVIEQKKVVHQIIMVDELKVEERLRWDPTSDCIIGLCREHSSHLPLEFKSENEPNMVFEALQKGETHLAKEVTVGAIGLLSKESSLLSARTGLISGSCKQETGEQHALVLKTALNAAKITKLRTVSIASDGEARRGEALVRLTFKRELASSSPIYPLLRDLEFMDFMVGDDDLTLDKDAKHVLKCFRNWLLRARGQVVLDIQITTAILRSQLSDRLSTQRINSLLKTNDKQDVKLAYDLLSEIWRLPPVVDPLRPRYVETRNILRILGSVFRHLLFPHVCPSLSLSQQLQHLSAAAHLLLALMHETNAGARFMPSQLYLNAMLMVKNAYFCVAKAQVDDPEGEFWIMLLGTDRLEELFGILRTVVGSDSNVDVLQFALRTTGTTEAATILAQFPQWDKAPRRLKLPLLSEDDIEITHKQDHIKPKDWTGDVKVANVNLRTCWIMGRRDIAQEFPLISGVLDRLSQLKMSGEKINILQPFGKDMVHAERALDDFDDSAEDFGPTVPNTACADGDPPSACEPDAEDAVAEQSGDAKRSPTFAFGGQQVYKARYLTQRFRDYKNPHAGSRDRLKRVANMSRYMVQTENKYSSVVRSDSCGEQEIVLDLPFVSLLKCEQRYFVCIGEVTDIVHLNEHCPVLSTGLLREGSTFVTFQLLYLRPASDEDDPEGKNDWVSSKRGNSFTIPGALVELIDPDLHTPEDGAVRLLFDSQDIMAMGAPIFGRLTRDLAEQVPAIARSRHFPYADPNGKLCFMCENADTEREIEAVGTCAHCTPLVKIGNKAADILNHNAQHILFDPHFPREMQPCGFCLRRDGLCVYVLRKSPDTDADYQVVVHASSCPALVRFSYQTASRSTEKNPSSNVPLPCPAPGCKKVVWRYNLRAHFKSCHPHLPSSIHEPYSQVGKTEQDLLQVKWKARFTKKRRKSKKGKQIDEDVSERHKTSRAIRENNIPEDDEPENAVANVSPEHTNSLSVPEDNEKSEDDSESEYGVTDVGDLEESDDEVNFPVSLVAHTPKSNTRHFASAADTLDIDGSQPHSSDSMDKSEALGSVLPVTRITQVSPIPAPVVIPELPSQPLHPLASPLLHTNGRPARRAKRTLYEAFGECICGNTVDEAQRATEAVRCKARGCETEWFHLECAGLNYALADWRCDSCRRQ